MGLPNQNTSNNLTCTDASTSGKSFIFEGTNGNPSMAIIKGVSTLLEVALNDVFMPVDKYIFQELTLEANSSIMLGVGNILSTLGEVQFLSIIVEYPKFDTADVIIATSEKYIRYELPDGGNQQSIGKIMIMTGSTKDQFGLDLNSSPGEMRIINPHELFDVTIKILAFN